MSENKTKPIRRIRYQKKGEKGVNIGVVWPGVLPNGSRTFDDGKPVPDQMVFYTEDTEHGSDARPYLRAYFQKDGFIKEYPIDEKPREQAAPDPFAQPDDGIPF